MYKDTGLIFAGELFMATSTNGVPGALNGPINVPSLQITPPTTEVRNRLSNQPGNYGQALDVVNVPADPTSVTLQFDSLPAELLAEALGEVERAGQVGVVAQDGVELGADAVKVPFTGGPEFKDVVQGAGVPVIIAGGPKQPDIDGFLAQIQTAKDAGASGVSTGRNVFQDDDPGALMSRIAAIFP